MFIILYFVQLEMFVFPVFCERQFVTQEQRKWIKLYVVSLILHYLYYYTWFIDLSHTTETSLYLELMSTHLRVPPSHSGCSLLSWSHPGPPPPPHLPSVDHRKTQTLGFIILITTLFSHSSFSILTRVRDRKSKRSASESFCWTWATDTISSVAN